MANDTEQRAYESKAADELLAMLLDAQDIPEDEKTGARLFTRLVKRGYGAERIAKIFLHAAGGVVALGWDAGSALRFFQGELDRWLEADAKARTRE